MKTLTIKTFAKEFAIHTAIFLSLTILFYLMKTYPGPLDAELLSQFTSSIPFFIYGISFCVLFYHLYFQKVLLRKPMIQNGKILAALIIAFLVIDMLFLNYEVHQRGETHIIWFDLTAIFRLILFGAYAITYSYIRGFSWLRLQKAKADKEKASASLQNLRSQIEPHFIFNTLNNIYALSLEENASKTSNSIEEISTLFRYTLKESKAEKVPVADELEFIEKYIHLHSIRLQENKNIRLQTNINWDKKPAMIAPLMIINFIENAFKYGISTEQPSLIEITAAVHDAHLHLKVKNTIHQNGKAVQNGFGLDNTKKRLDLLYAAKYDLKEIQKEGIHEIDLNINLS